MAIAPSLGGSTLSFGLTVLTQLCVYLKHKRRRVIDLVQDFEKLEYEVRHLSKKLQDVNEKIEHLSTSMQRNHQYDVWLVKVSTIQDKFRVANNLYTEMCGDIRNQNSREKYEEMMQKKIWTRQFFKLARLDKDIGKLVLDAYTLRKDLSLEELTRPVEPEKVHKLAAEDVDIDGHPHKQYLDNLLGFIGEEECKIIGIHGMPGVGVSNIMKNLNNYFLSSRCSLNFDYVIWVTIEEEWNSDRVQKEIIERLKAPSGKTKQQRSEIISSKLLEKKYLLLLDNVVGSIKMEDIGDFKLHDQGKMVMATTRMNGLRGEDLDTEIKVETLSQSESWYMFRQFFVEELSQVEMDVVDRILTELGGFPKCIKSMAKRLRKHRNLMSWQGLKQRLESNVAKPELVPLGGLNHFFSVAYEELGDNQKKCLLYATLYPKHYMIPQNYLIECWEAENFLIPPQFKGDGALVIDELEERWLLEKSCEKYVKMPIMFRKIAMSLPLPEQGSEASFARFYPEDRLVTERWCSDAKWISATQSNVEILPVSPQCVGLSTLLLQKNPNLMSIADEFFNQMHKLLVLDLHGTNIKSLPSSISSLTALRCSYLNGCHCLEALPEEFVHLKHLEVLDIRNTPVKCSSATMSHLLGLKCLRISYPEGHGILIQLSRSWCRNLEQLAIEFSKEENQEVALQVKQKVMAGFGDGFDFKVNKDSKFGSFELYLKKDLSGENRCTFDPFNHVTLTTNSPSTSGTKSNHNQRPMSGNISLIKLSDNISASVRGNEIVEEWGGSSPEKGNEMVEQGNGKLEEGMSSGLKKNSKDGNIVRKGILEEGNEKTDEGMENGLKKELDQHRRAG